MSSSFINLKSDHPLLWKETRAALGLAPDEEKEDKHKAKRARKG